MKKSSTFSKIFGFTLLIAFVIFYVVTAVLDLISLSNDKKVDSYDFDITQDGISVEGNFYYLTEGPVFTMKHSISYIIPTGTEYFFTLFNDSLSKYIFVRADEGYAEEFYKEVDENEANGTNAGAYLKGKVRELRPKIERELNAYVSDLFGDGLVPMTYENNILYIDLTTRFQSILRLATAMVFIVLAVVVVVFAKKKEAVQLRGVSKVMMSALVILVLVAVGAMIYTLSFLM